eukprot:363616-Chlamydomonas_euryale.AAC.9
MPAQAAQVGSRRGANIQFCPGAGHKRVARMRVVLLRTLQTVSPFQKQICTRHAKWRSQIVKTAHADIGTPFCQVARQHVLVRTAGVPHLSRLITLVMLGIRGLPWHAPARPQQAGGGQASRMGGCERALHTLPHFPPASKEAGRQAGRVGMSACCSPTFAGHAIFIPAFAGHVVQEVRATGVGGWEGEQIVVRVCSC